MTKQQKQRGSTAKSIQNQALLLRRSFNELDPLRMLSQSFRENSIDDAVIFSVHCPLRLTNLDVTWRPLMARSVY